ncbi:unnamed protein product, partial [Ectocarpus sp. 4 AP-2014]
QQHARVSALVEASDWPKLWEADELLKELRAGRLLAGFQTEPPAFAPTFKGIRGETGGYSAKRIPSYTDRILWKSLPGHAANLDLLKFTSFPEITSSDHKPIHGAFVVKLSPEVGAPPPPSKMFGRRARMPLAVLDVPRMAQHPPPRLLLEDLEVFDLPGIAGGGVRNPYVVFSSDPKHLVKASPAGKPPKTTVRKKTLRAKWNRYAFQLAISDPVLLRHSHVSLVVMDKERGRKSKGEVIGVANLSLAEVLWINNSPPASANARSSSPSSASAAAASSAAASSRRRSSLPLRRRSLSPDRARRSNSTRERFSLLEGHGRGGGDGGSGVGGQDNKIGEAASAGEEASSLSSSQQRRGTGMPRHRSHSSLPWGFFRHHNGGLSYREDGDSVHNTAADVAACGDGGSGLRDHHHHHHRRASSGSGGGSDVTSVGCEGQDVAGASAAARATAAAAAAPGVSPTSTTGTCSRALGGCEPSAGTTADSKEGSAHGGGTGGGGGGYNRRSSFFHSLAGHHLLHHHHHQDEQDGRAAAAAAEQRLGPMFDIPLVKSGLHRGRISGRCTLVLGSGTGVNLLRLGSVRALGPGGVASVGGVGVAGLSDGGGSSGEGKYSGGGGDFRRGAGGRAATFPPPATAAAAKLRDRASEGGEIMGHKAPPGLASKSISDRVLGKSRRLRSDRGGSGRDSTPAGCVCM